MKKVFALDELDCPTCGLKMEDGIRKIAGVENVQVNFLTQKLTLEADEDAFDRILNEAVKVCRRIEPDCRIVM